MCSLGIKGYTWVNRGVQGCTRVSGLGEHKYTNVKGLYNLIMSILVCTEVRVVLLICRPISNNLKNEQQCAYPPPLHTLSAKKYYII